jgi:hypothetical protein
MGPFRWITALLYPRSPEQSTRVGAGDECIRCIRPDGRVDAVAWSDLQTVSVETNDAGPFVEDVYFHLEGSEYGFYVPQAAEGTDELVRRLTELPGFDSEAFLAAMRSTANERFICWRRGRV